MEPARKRKIQEPKEKRVLENHWLEDFFFVRSSDSHCICLLCEKQVKIGKSTGSKDFKRHFEKLHPNELVSDDTKRKAKALELSKEYYAKGAPQFTAKAIEDERTNLLKASYVISHKIIKKGKPFNEGEFVKDCLVSLAPLICPQASASFEQLNFGRATITRRMEDVSNHIKVKNLSKFRKCQLFSIALDESTDTKDMAQVLFFLRGITREFEIVEELIEMRTMDGTTRGIFSV